MNILENFTALLEASAQDQVNKLFAHFPEAFMPYLSFKEYAAEHVLLRAYDKAESICFLLAGQVRAIKEHENGSVYSFARFEPLYLFGEFEAFAGTAVFKSTLICETDCSIMKMPAEIFLQWMGGDAKALFLRTQSITQQLLEQTRNERSYLFFSGKERLLSYLAAEYRKNHKNKSCIIEASRQQIADEIGFSLKTVQRNLKGLKESGLIQTQGRAISLDESQYDKIVALCDANAMQTMEEL
ncbi:Crp/Fnr family transcriptional regulator [Oscillospiraceae bacterium MB08-C2-2]|nr:Crp/Fnr family transcriptional regulator [Oscillospiraceae bacterium MB08-C2-2]